MDLPSCAVPPHRRPRESLRRLKDAGLGDPEDPVAETAQVDDVAAAREVLAEARALRSALAAR